MAPSPEQLSNPNFVGSMGTAYDYVDLKYKTKNSTPLTIEVKSGKNGDEFGVGPAVREQVKIR